MLTKSALWKMRRELITEGFTGHPLRIADKLIQETIEPTKLFHRNAPVTTVIRRLVDKYSADEYQEKESL